jgi:hypothetical protein
MVAGFLYLVAEKSRSLNMQSFNRSELIIQLSEAYRCSRAKGTPDLLPKLAPAASRWRAFHCREWRRRRREVEEARQLAKICHFLAVAKVLHDSA